MKVSRFLSALLFVSACGGDPRGGTAPQQNDGSEITARLESTPEASEGTTGAQPGPDVETKAPVGRAASAPARVTPAADARAAAVGPVTMAANAEGVNSDAAVLRDFNARIAAYMKVYRDAAKGDAKPKETSDPADISATKAALAARIQAARPAAKQGDIFTAEIRHKFRRLLAPELKGEDGRDARAVMKDDAPPASAIPWKVNAKYPEGQPLPSVPANLLRNMPTLPEPLEYRIIEKHLLLLDTKSDLIVDYMWNAIR